ncbi:substrate-binding periplasmic protein [Zooshikella harenae]|uniref:ABC transporter substrate-binding protein n=1 Tax=Zooshikella harenae TaxID=2827238 RepID=A0ABS5ZHY5_9GAMM|nr:ABC transporter substrate-binding protein [Zooshikella harenae]MBU2713681.1 ABC transporter substrate-binding protein [Zooshikella harenae]
MKSILFILIGCLFSRLLLSETNVLYADYRHRPPEMVRIGDMDTFFGPLRDIIEEAAGKIDYTVNWRFAPFPRSLEDLKKGRIDIIPRTIKTKERESFVSYLGPIGYQQKDIHFLVTKGMENTINSYEDLYLFRVGVKRKTAYFSRFDNDKKMEKVVALDDKNMAEMIIKNRFSVMIVLDTAAIESALHKFNYKDYAYANYKYIQKIGNYYGMSKKSRNAHVFEQLNKSIKEMVDTGRVDYFYEKYNIYIPSHD